MGNLCDVSAAGGWMACENAGIANSHPCILKNCYRTMDPSVLEFILGGFDNDSEMVATITIISKDEKSHDVLWRCV